MAVEEVCKYVNSTMVFFQEYASHLNSRISTHNEDVEDTGLMIAWIFYIAKMNSDRIIQKLNRFQKNIYPTTNIREFTYSDLWNSLRGKKVATQNQLNVDVYKSIQNDPLLSAIVQKTTEYVLRAKETLELELEELSYSSLFIPTDYMLIQKQATQRAYNNCLKLISDFQIIIPPSIKQNKSWLTKVLRLGISLVQIQRVAYGLLDNLKDIFKEKNLESRALQDHKIIASKTLKEIVQKLDSQQVLLPPTKETRKILCCENAEDMPSNEVHYNYFPKAINTPLYDVKILIQKNSAEITAAAVLNCTRKNPKTVS